MSDKTLIENAAVENSSENANENISDNINENTNEKADESEDNKKFFISENKIEVLVAIFLGITVVLSAWASWIGSLHDGNQASNYAKSNNLSSEGTALYNIGMQQYTKDLLVWNTIVDYAFDSEIASVNGNTAEANLINEKNEAYIEQNASDYLKEAIKWSYTKNETEGIEISPFEMPGLLDNYYKEAQKQLDEAQKHLEEGQQDNAKSDAYNLVNVIYSIILFLLGIVGIFKSLPNRFAVLLLSIAGMIITTIYMFTIPLPTGFDLFSYFG